MAGSLRILKVRFAAGSKVGAPVLEVSPGTALILVGPNNSGKSLALQEMDRWCQAQETSHLVIGSLEVDFPTDPNQAEQLLRQLGPVSNRSIADPNDLKVEFHQIRGGGSQPRELAFSASMLQGFVRNPNSSPMRQYFTSSSTIFLDGRNRFALINPQPAGDLKRAPQNHLWKLFLDDVGRERVRTMVKDAFGLYFLVDPTGLPTYSIRLSTRPPKNLAEEKMINDALISFYSQAKPINEFSDGVQSFVGLVAAVLSLPDKIIIIDEPDAFLHPPLARRLATNLVRIAREREASLVIATHSAEFLTGCIEGAADVSIVRLTYDGTAGTARQLPPDSLSRMATDPLLRSTNVLRALFHRAVIVTEGDTDRAFYDEINRRLVSEERGLPDAQFLNAQNYQTIHRLVAPLRKIGIPAAAIVDFDILHKDQTGWGELLDACQIPTDNKATLSSERIRISDLFDTLGSTNGKKLMKEKGANGANNNEEMKREMTLLGDLAAFGLFVVPVGELESWMPQLGVGGHATDWLIDVFDRLGTSESSGNYVRPGTDDVWAFLDEISNWVSAPRGVD